MTDSVAENEYSHSPRRTETLAAGTTEKGGSVEMLVLHTGAYVYLEYEMLSHAELTQFGEKGLIE